MENINEIGLLAHPRNSNKNGGEEMRDDSTISSEFQISVASAQVFHLYFLFPYFSRVVENTWKIDCTLKLVGMMLAVWTLFSRQSMTGFIVNCLIK